MVWHHRRSTVKAYLGQQRGYGIAEALLKRKHPEKFRGFRNDLSWSGRIYTRAGLGLNVGDPVVHYGVFGMGLFQTIYAPPQVWWPLLATGLEWWICVVLLLGLAAVLPFRLVLIPHRLADLLPHAVVYQLGNPLFLLPLAMLATTFGVAYWVAGQASPPPHQRRWWSRLLIAAMHVAQPVERGYARYKTRFRTIEIPEAFHELRRRWEARARGALDKSDVELWSEDWVPREKLLERVLQMAADKQWFVRIDPGWAPHDVRFYGDRWSKADVSTVTENLGGGRLLTKVGLRMSATLYQKALVFMGGYAFVLAWLLDHRTVYLTVPALGVLLLRLLSARRRLRRTVVAALLEAARELRMTLVGAPELLRSEPLAPVAGDATATRAREAV
jgi:hypothetical protein